MVIEENKKKKKISKELEEKLKNIYPESRGLDIDRQYDANNMLDPTNPEDVQEWSKDPTKADLKGFDDKASQEPSITKVTKKLASVMRGQGVGYIEQETDRGNPDRFTDPSQELGRLIQKYKDKIYNFQTMKAVIRRAWSEDSNVTGLVNNLTDGDFNVLFRTSVIQSYIDSNTRPEMVNYLMRRFGVEPVRASRILNKLTSTTRAKLYTKARMSKMPKITFTKASKRNTKARWSQQQFNFISANRHLPVERLTELYNSRFSDKRTTTAIRNQVYKARKSTDIDL